MHRPVIRPKLTDLGLEFHSVIAHRVPLERFLNYMWHSISAKGCREVFVETKFLRPALARMPIDGPGERMGQN